MEDYSSENISTDGSDRSSSLDWISWFHELAGNDFFAKVDPEFIEDKFNLTGLNLAVPNFILAYKLITEELYESLDPKTEVEVDRAAKHLYGLMHARFILTNAGLSKMADRFNKAEFGRCPRALCEGQRVVPVGITDIPGERSVKVYCPLCQDVYSPQSKEYESVDGAYFTTSFPHMLFQVYPDLLPKDMNTEIYVPKIFGFKVHKLANEQRKQQELKKRL